MEDWHCQQEQMGWRYRRDEQGAQATSTLASMGRIMRRTVSLGPTSTAPTPATTRLIISTGTLPTTRFPTSALPHQATRNATSVFSATIVPA